MEDNNKDRRELLLIKQNPEGYEDNAFREAKEKYMRPLTKADNFFYYFKWILLIGGLAAVLIVFMVFQTVNRESEDIRVMLISYDHVIAQYEEPLKNALEKVCPDNNGDGEIYAQLYPIDLTTRADGLQYDLAESEKLTGELRRPSSQMIVSDEEFYDYAISGADGAELLVDFSGKFPEEMLAFDGRGIKASKLLPDAGLPDNIIIYVRSELSGFDDPKDGAQYRDLAEEVLLKLKNGG